MGIRRLEDFNTVFRLKSIWLIFKESGSLWVAWLKRHIFKRKGLWGTKPSPKHSWGIRKLLMFKHKAADFLHCRLGDGNTALFWHDNWTGLGPLIKYVGVEGPKLLRIPLYAKVKAASKGLEWNLPGARSDRIQVALTRISAIPVPSSESGKDCFEWKATATEYRDTFSSSATWKLIRQQAPVVPWHSMIWFSLSTPRLSFIQWLVLLHRLPTRDRLARWGLLDNPMCVLCQLAPESHSHLFFDCCYSRDVWIPFASACFQSPPLDVDQCSSWLAAQPQARSSTRKSFAKLILQVAIYLIWSERNARIFKGESSPAEKTRLTLDRFARDIILSRKSSTSAHPWSLMDDWLLVTSTIQIL
ncbi:PREDICTED: uncharacterized protein LOC109116242 [Tarenaya hassleriana]|uniref:uncharacterized protein LOC109116242 n=1 Tax=Tarenaya hassleriana TaxID=28532 RepID=UPI0008FD6868|nr:PREDICTED: uncharacterized protein LOC109116242 [Tarenaya hassleriana]